MCSFGLQKLNDWNAKTCFLFFFFSFILNFVKAVLLRAGQNIFLYYSFSFFCSFYFCGFTKTHEQKKKKCYASINQDQLKILFSCFFYYNFLFSFFFFASKFYGKKIGTAHKIAIQKIFELNAYNFDTNCNSNSNANNRVVL